MVGDTHSTAELEGHTGPADVSSPAQACASSNPLLCASLTPLCAVVSGSVVQEVPLKFCVALHCNIAYWGF